MGNSAASRPQHASDRVTASRTIVLIVGVLVAGASLLYLPTALMSQADTQAGPPIVKASDKWITLGVDQSSSQVPTALSQYEVIQPVEPKRTRPRHKEGGMLTTSRGPQGVHSRAQVSSRPVRSSVASACPNVSQRGAGNRLNSGCPSHRQHAATLGVAKNQGHWPHPSTPA
jgi:hypothetical protein